MARAVENAAAQLISEPSLRALLAEMAEFSVRTRARGQDYVASGRVGSLHLHGDGAHAKVSGSRTYETLWEREDDLWISDCSCPVAVDCKHAYAVACCIVRYCQQTFGFDDPLADRLLPSRVVMPSMSSPLRAAPSAPAPARSESGADRLAGSSTLAQLRSARYTWEREHAASQLLAHAPAGNLSVYLPPFPEILAEPDPDLLCWRLAKEVERRVQGWFPAALEPFRHRPDLEAKQTTRARAALAEDVLEWAAQTRVVSQRSLRLVFSLINGGWRGPGVSIEARVTTPRINDATRTSLQLQQLRNELRRTPGLLPPGQAALLEWLVAHNLGGAPSSYGHVSGVPPGLLNLALERIGDSNLATWADDLPPAWAERAGVRPGATVRHSTAPVRLLPSCVARDGDAWVELRFVWPDGREKGLDDVVYLSSAASVPERNMILAGGEFASLVEEPPPHLIERFREAGGMRLPPERRGAVLGLLASRFPHLEKSLANHTRVHAVTPVVALDLRDEEWLQLRLFAHGGPTSWRPGSVLSDAATFEYTPDGRWVMQGQEPAAPKSVPAGYEDIDDIAAATDEATATSTSAATPGDSTGTAPEVWFDVPDPKAVQPALEWLAATRATPGPRARTGRRELPPYDDIDVGWWIPASQKRMAELAECWDRRPREVVYFGTERVRRLLTGSDRLVPQLRVAPSGMDWFSVSADWQSEGLRLTESDVAALRSAEGRFVKLSTGWVRRDVGEEYDENMEILADLGIDPDAGEHQVSLWQLAGAKAESIAALERLGGDPEMARAVRELRKQVAEFTGFPPVPLPSGLTAVLRPYQKQGLDFLAYTSSLGIGAVLADDMGLGKTVQALAWLVHLCQQDPTGGPSLVVCPASVMHNWAREAERFAPQLRVLVLTSGKERHERWQEIPQFDLVVTNYALLRQDIERWRDVDLRVALLDEAQNIKNPDAGVSRAALTLRARHRVVLTGTPLENRALDLWSIMAFVNPGYLGSRARFTARFDSPGAVPHARTLLAAKLRPVLMRRTKAEVATDLPDRIEERLDCELTQGQRRLYLAELRRSRQLVESLDDSPRQAGRNRIAILAALTRLRQICCHPALAGGSMRLGSGKFNAFFDLIEPLLAEGHKVLAFSPFVACLKLLSGEMRHRGVAHRMLTGQTQAKRRADLVREFQEDAEPGVFLISLKAGGTGLNLTGASYVILFDPWWNPAVEAQAIDRSHRIGQDRTVIAYRMLAEGTIEEKIWELQQRKAALVRDILGESSLGRAFTRDDLEFLFTDPEA